MLTNIGNIDVLTNIGDIDSVFYVFNPVAEKWSRPLQEQGLSEYKEWRLLVSYRNELWTLTGVLDMVEIYNDTTSTVRIHDSWDSLKDITGPYAFLQDVIVI